MASTDVWIFSFNLSAKCFQKYARKRKGDISEKISIFLVTNNRVQDLDKMVYYEPASSVLLLAIFFQFYSKLRDQIMSFASFVKSTKYRRKGLQTLH